MAGNKAGGKKAAATNKRRYGKDYYQVIGATGGEAHVPSKGFGSNRELAKKLGRKGGLSAKKPRYL